MFTKQHYVATYLQDFVFRTMLVAGKILSARGRQGSVPSLLPLLVTCPLSLPLAQGPRQANGFSAGGNAEGKENKSFAMLSFFRRLKSCRV